MSLLRTKFKKEIVAEFLIPKRKSAKVIILLDGLPSVPAKKPLLEFFAKKGYWVFHPRYRGTWESEGKFLQASPEKDILDIIDQLPKGFKNLYNGTTHKIDPKTIYIFGGSGGGPAAILASRHPAVTKAVVFAPVVDWQTPTEAETIDSLAEFIKNGYGSCYRIVKNGWNKLKTGKFYNPVNHLKELDGKKIFIIQAKDDKVILWQPVAKFAQAINCQLLLVKKGEHLSSSNFIKPYFYNQIKKFLDKS